MSVWLREDRARWRWSDIMLGALALLAAPVIALLPLPLLGAALLVAAVIALSILAPVWGLYLLVLSVPAQEYLNLPSGMSLTQAIAGLSLLGQVLAMLRRRDGRLPRPLLLPWLLFLLALLISACFSPYNSGESLKTIGRWLAAFLAFELTLTTITTPRRAWGLILCLLLAPLASALIGLWQFVTATGPESFQIGRFVRAYGPFGKPNPLAGYLNMAWPLALALALALLRSLLRTPRSPGEPFDRAALLKTIAALVALGASAAILLAGVGATYSRGGWLGIAAGLAIMAAFAGRRIALLDALLVALLIAALLAGNTGLLPASIAGRIASISENLRIFDAGRVTVTDESFAVVERMAHWQAGALMLIDHPISGIGSGNFNNAYRDYFVGRWYISQGHAHNYYIHIAAEAGLLGLLAYLGLIGASMRSGLAAVRRCAAGPWRAVAVGGCGIIAAVATHQIFENLHVLNLGIQLSAVWGLLALIAAQSEKGIGSIC